MLQVSKLSLLLKEHTNILSVCSFSEMLTFTSDVMGHTRLPKKFYFFLRVFSQKSLGSSRCSRANLRQALCSFCSAVVFVLVKSGTLTLTEENEACSSLDVVLGSFVTSWMSGR